MPAPAERPRPAERGSVQAISRRRRTLGVSVTQPRRPTTVHQFRGRRGRRTDTHGFMPTKTRMYGSI